MFLLGFALVGLADPRYDLSVTTPWVLASIVLYLATVVISFVVVVPGMKRAAQAGGAGDAGDGEGAAAAGSAVSSRARITVGSGVVALLLLAVVVLMVWKP